MQFLFKVNAYITNSSNLQYSWPFSYNNRWLHMSTAWGHTYLLCSCAQGTLCRCTFLVLNSIPTRPLLWPCLPFFNFTYAYEPAANHSDWEITWLPSHVHFLHQVGKNFWSNFSPIQIPQLNAMLASCCFPSLLSWLPSSHKWAHSGITHWVCDMVGLP